MTSIEQRLKHRVDAPGAVDVSSEIAPAGLQVGQQRRAGEHFGDVVQREVQPGFMGDGGRMQAGVGRAAGCRHDSGCVFQ